MDEQLCEAGTETILKNVQDLALKTFVATRCASHTFHKEVEELRPYMQSSDCEKVIELESEKTTLIEVLQREKERANIFARANKVAAADNKHLSERLKAAEVELEVEKWMGPRLEVVVKENEKLKQDNQGQKMTYTELQTAYVQYQAAHVAGASVICECADRVFAPFGLPVELESYTIEHFCDWLEVSMEVLESCGRIWGELKSKDATRALAASFCALMQSGDASRSLGRSDLRQMKEAGFEWPLSEIMDPAHLPGLAKAIANNFMQTFFKAHGPRLACSEARRVDKAVKISPCREFCVYDLRLADADVPLRVLIDFVFVSRQRAPGG